MRNVSAILLLISLSTPAGATPLTIEKMAEISQVLSSNPAISSTFDQLANKQFSFIGIVGADNVSRCAGSELRLLFSKWSYEGSVSERKDKVVRVEYSDCSLPPKISFI